MTTLTQRSLTPPLLHPAALVSGSLPSRNLAATKAFYEDVLGLEVRQPTPDRLVARLGYEHTYVIEEADDFREMSILSHNGIYVLGSIDDAHEKLTAVADTYGIKKMTKPALQHGSYGFFLQDRDGNWWEVNRAIDGPSEKYLPDLTGRAEMTPEETREWFQSRGDILYTAMESAGGAPPATGTGKSSVLPTTCISHGTLESLDIHDSRRFYEEFLGLDVKQLTPVSLAVGLETDHRYAVVAAPNSTPNMPHTLRNWLLFVTEDDLIDARGVVAATASTRGITDVSDVVRHSDGRVSFELRDLDRNWWELYFDPAGAPKNLFA